MSSSRPPTGPIPFIVVMGVAGTGKTTLGTSLAKALKLPYLEGDDLHPRSNVEKMSAGIPLTDADREPWLAKIRAEAEEQTRAQWRAIGNGTTQGTPRLGVVATCSSLKKYYRDILRGKIPVVSIYNEDEDDLEDIIPLSTYFVYIDGPRDLMEDRISKRIGHFMKATMLDSQLRALELPIGEDGAVMVALSDSTEDQVATAIAGLKNYGVSIV